MKLLVDQNLPQRLASILQAEGHDATHTEDVGLAMTDDPAILSWCCSRQRMLVTADKKLTKFLATGTDCPSVLITREMRTMAMDEVAAILIANLPQIEETINEHGNAVFSLAPRKPIRAELLPLGVSDKTT